MRTHQQVLIQLLTRQNSEFNQDSLNVIQNLDTLSKANFFVDVVFCISAMNFIQEQYWLLHKTQIENVNFSNFVKKYFKSELIPLLFFHSELENSSISQIEKFKKNAIAIQETSLKYFKTLAPPENKIFAVALFKLMSKLFDFEHQLYLTKKDRGLDLGFSLGRAFDHLDEVLNLDYSVDSSTVDPTVSERISQGSASGVQSSYLTVLLALSSIRIPTNSRLIDLGSGFGRVGMAVGFLRPDISFTGFEFVNHRVDVANASCRAFGIDKHVQFVTQDLSKDDFVIPEAEIYYMYDPFNEKTYKHVLAQLNLISARRKIYVITSGDAKQHLLAPDQRIRWSRPQEFESGSFCLFRST